MNKSRNGHLNSSINVANDIQDDNIDDLLVSTNFNLNSKYLQSFSSSLSQNSFHANLVKLVSESLPTINDDDELIVDDKNIQDVYAKTIFYLKLKDGKSSSSVYTPIYNTRPIISNNSCSYSSLKGLSSYENKTNFASYFNETVSFTSTDIPRSNSSWNYLFQTSLDLPETTSEEVIMKYSKLNQLSVDFIERAKTYGRTIISEYFLPFDQQTIKPVDLGGVAGGRKYLVRGILFKLAKDVKLFNSDRYMYGSIHGPNDEFAAKAAGHDLKGAGGYFRFSNIGLRFEFLN